MSCESVGCGQIIGDSAYMRLTPGKRERVKAKARRRYRSAAGGKQRRCQYLKALNRGYIERPGRAVQSHGIINREDGVYALQESEGETTE